MTTKVIKIGLIALISYLLVCLFTPDFAFADAAEDAFRQNCSGAIQTNTPCSTNTLSQLYVDLGTTLYCCENSPTAAPVALATATPQPAATPTGDDPRANAFLQKCYGELGGSYHLSVASDLASNPCYSGDTQVGSQNMGLTNLFCCHSETRTLDEGGNIVEHGDGQNPLTLNVSVTRLKRSSLDDINPLRRSQVLGVNTTPADIINRALTTVIFPISGIALLLLIIIGGFQIVSASVGGKQNYIDIGKKRITSAVVGFVVLLLVYWIWRAITLATGLTV